MAKFICACWLEPRCLFSYSGTTRQNQYGRNYQQDYARPYSYNTSVGPYTNNYNNSGGYRMNPGGGAQIPGQGGNRQNNRNYNYQVRVDSRSIEIDNGSLLLR